MKKIILTLALFPLLLQATEVGGDTWKVPDEELHYDVRFKWGLIDANVGIATLTTCNVPGSDSFVATLSGKSVDLLGHYYEAADTVQATLLHGSLEIPSHERMLTEHGRFSIETITGNANGAASEGPVIAHLDNGKVIRSRTSDYASGLTTDLLSVFYYIREIDYSHFQPGQRFHIDIQGANQTESLDITYLGAENVDVNGVAYMGAFHISLTFGGDASGKIDTLQAWIADNESHIPVKIDGTLSVGRIECRYIDGSGYSNIGMND